MHGIEHRRQKRRTIRLSAPRWPFSPAPGSMLPGSPLAASARNRSLVTAFRSPATAAASRRPPFRGQSSQPATSLPSKSLPCPFGPSAPLPLPVCAGCGRFMLLARCTSTTRFGLPRQRSPLPSGTFTSLGIKAFNRVCCLPVRLTNPPDFLSLPAARPMKVWAADHRSRSATFPPACCSSNLLEPSSLCSRCAFPSTAHRRLIESEDDAIVPVGEADPGVGGALRRSPADRRPP
jgi:hypothetical protein